ncbi:UNVERIFIED_CONTAM: hypothetical protein GTU68_029988 [Idotea baltica]|nr:hypothetical protein [Idotea baltica]
MAGVLYLIRLFVYHSAEAEQVVMERFKIMEHRLYRYITLPAMVSTFIFGIAMLLMNSTLFSFSWVHWKLTLVLILALSTLYSGKIVKDFSNDKCRHSEKFFRFFNELPTLLMVIIVFLAILKP